MNVPAERSTAQRGQVKSSDCWNCQSAACGDVIRIICINGFVESQMPFEHDTQHSDLVGYQQVDSSPRVDGGAFVQLPCTGHPTQSTLADYGTGTYPSLSLILFRIDYCNAVLHSSPS